MQCYPDSGCNRGPACPDKYRWATIFPRAVRAADATLGPFQPHAELSRLLSLNSYIFWSILWKKGVSRPERRQAITSIARVVDMFMLAPPGGTVSLRESSYPGFEVRAYFSRGQTMREAFKHSHKGRAPTLR